MVAFWLSLPGRPRDGRFCVYVQMEDNRRFCRPVRRKHRNGLRMEIGFITQERMNESAMSGPFHSKTVVNFPSRISRDAGEVSDSSPPRLMESTSIFPGVTM